MSELKNPQDSKLLRFYEECKKEAENAVQDRRKTNEENWRFYHLKQDYSHKLQGQSREFLPRQSMATEQIATFIHQSLVDQGQWFSMEHAAGVKEAIFTPSEAARLLKHFLEKAGFYEHILKATKNGLLSQKLIAKITGEMKERREFFTKRVKAEKFKKTELFEKSSYSWALKIDVINFDDFLEDPEKENLYLIHKLEKDLWRLKRDAQKAPEVYETEAIERLRPSSGKDLDRDKRQAQRQGRNQTIPNASRKRVVLEEIYGQVLDPDTGELIHENVVFTVANGKEIIRKPEKFPYWTRETPFVTAELIEDRALMDAPTMINRIQNELFNLIIDSGLASVHGIKQVRVNWLQNPKQVENGIRPGTSYAVNNKCPPGEKAIERVDTGSLSSEGTNAFNLAGQEFVIASLTPDLRAGILPPRSVKATEVAETSQTVNNVFNAIAKKIEESYVKKILEKSWTLLMQNYKDLDESELEALLGKQRAEELSKISQKEIFARTVQGFQFKVFGITQTINKIRDFRKLTALLQTVSGSDILAEEFSRVADFAKLLMQIMKSLDIDIDQIKLDEIDEELQQQEGQGAGSAVDALQAIANLQSQTAQAGGVGGASPAGGESMGFEPPAEGLG